MRAKKTVFLLFFVLLLLVANPSRYFDSVARGVRIFAYSVLPSMLPYFFFTKLLTSIGGAEALSRTVGRPVGKIYKVGGACGYALVMSVLSGYPVGARILSDLCGQGLISEKDARKAASFCSTSGSMFVLGSVGASILGDVKAAWVILVAHYLGALLNGVLYCSFGKGGGGRFLPLLPSKNADDVLAGAMYESVISLALVGGFIAVCNLSADMVSDLLKWLGWKIEEGSVLGATVFSLFEVTRGCMLFSSCDLPRAVKTACAAAAVSFGGLSVLLQSLAFLGKCGVKAWKMTLMKATQAALTFGICLAAGVWIL